MCLPSAPMTTPPTTSISAPPGYGRPLRPGRPPGTAPPEGYAEQLADLRERAVAARAEIAVIEATVTSEDGTVTATVAPGGELRHLELTGQASVGPALAAVVVATIAEARHDAADRATRALAPVLGPESTALLRSHLRVGGAVGEPV